MSVHADGKESFWMLAQIAAKSIADPPWFAVPVDAQDDPDSVTVHFHVPGKMRSQLQVQVSDQSVTIRGGRERDERSPVRLCALPCQVVADRIETIRMGDLVRVRMPKRRPTVDSREASPTT
jgi:HSP20 family molecular chaperone IbpA